MTIDYILVNTGVLVIGLCSGFIAASPKVRKTFLALIVLMGLMISSLSMLISLWGGHIDWHSRGFSVFSLFMIFVAYHWTRRAFKEGKL